MVDRYMRGRLTLEKVNAAINDMATYAEANYQLIAAPKKNVAGDRWEKALEIRDIAMHEAVKGKHFFLETDMKGPSLKLDNSGKAILTVRFLSLKQVCVNFKQYHSALRKDEPLTDVYPFSVLTANSLGTTQPTHTLPASSTMARSEGKPTHTPLLMMCCYN
ncbi:putative spindle and kinetochore-associated protein [Rosa chinensis]|uniref:SKA complex subunit 1 homolog n=1 Tax=Rosa chinensis TaxID=74649 RepID=A0A2P6SFS6_ROSCH|nr:putative spindle and kinetochore-associated protein [Rosa chinensis]